jgi:hypothetical protein
MQTLIKYEKEARRLVRVKVALIVIVETDRKQSMVDDLKHAAERATAKAGDGGDIVAYESDKSPEEEHYLLCSGWLKLLAAQRHSTDGAGPLSSTATAGCTERQVRPSRSWCDSKGCPKRHGHA